MDACAGAISTTPKQVQGASASRQLNISGLNFLKNGWSLIARLTPESFPGSDESRKQTAVLKSMEKQFSPLGLHIYVVSDTALSADSARNWANDWNFEQIRFLKSPSEGALKLAFNGKDSIVLIDRHGRIAKRWSGLATFPALELALRQIVGTPVGMQMLNSDTVTKQGH